MSPKCKLLVHVTAEICQPRKLDKDFPSPSLLPRGLRLPEHPEHPERAPHTARYPCPVPTGTGHLGAGLLWAGEDERRRQEEGVAASAQQGVCIALLHHP